MSEAPVIRHVAASDLAGWLPLWLGYNRFYGRHDETALAAAVTQRTWERFLDPQEPVHAVVAEMGGLLVGLAHFLFHRSTTMLGDVCYLQDLFTDPATRGKGVATALIEAVYARAQERGTTRVYWHTQETNATARRVYDRIAAASGFIVYRRDL